LKFCARQLKKENSKKLSCLTEEVGSGRIAEGANSQAQARVFGVSIGMNFWVGMLMWVL
jgi:hypothetical protein